VAQRRQCDVGAYYPTLTEDQVPDDCGGSFLQNLEGLKTYIGHVDQRVTI
jgi:hypothetical protein